MPPQFTYRNLGLKNYKVGDTVGSVPGATDLRTQYGQPAPPSFGSSVNPLTQGSSPFGAGPQTLQNVMQLLGYHGPSMSPAQAVNQPTESPGGGVGGFIKDNAGALVGGAVGLYDAYSRNQQQNRDRGVAERELARQHQIEDEERARRKAVDPARAAIIKRMLEQAQSSGTYTGYGA